MVSPTVGHSLMFRQHRSCGMEGGGGGGGGEVEVHAN